VNDLLNLPPDDTPHSRQLTPAHTCAVRVQHCCAPHRRAEWCPLLHCSSTSAHSSQQPTGRLQAVQCAVATQNHTVTTGSAAGSCTCTSYGGLCCAGKAIDTWACTDGICLGCKLQGYGSSATPTHTQHTAAAYALMCHTKGRGTTAHRRQTCHTADMPSPSSVPYTWAQRTTTGLTHRLMTAAYCSSTLG
jgi:hypothetical protein